MSIFFGKHSEAVELRGLYGGSLVALLLFGLSPRPAISEGPFVVLDASSARSFVESFNDCDEEDVRNLVPNEQALDWIVGNAPLFDCPSARLIETYYFRWWTYRKHICQTPHGRVVTEFITPVGHAGPYNTISCALGHHVAEGRWLRDQSLVDEYVDFWLYSGPDRTPAPHFHKFSSWLPAALYERYLVTGKDEKLVSWLDDLVADYRVWQTERQRPDGLFWQFDVRDGMEESISGGRREQNARPTINSYMVANAQAISRIATLADRQDLAEEFDAKARKLRKRLVESLWDKEAEFFKVRLESGEFSNAREAIGYIPWMFDLAAPEHVLAWRQVNDPDGFWAPSGLTTAERRHPQFRTHGTGTCEWDGAVWPFATSQTLTGMARLLRNSEQDVVTKADYFDQLLRYANSHQQHGMAYVGEYHDEVTGEWLITGPKARRSRFYNHSTFNDLVISGLVGLVSRIDDKLEIHPLVPNGAWDWFCLDGVPYHGHAVTVIWDRTGHRYGRGAGLTLWVDGTKLGSTDGLDPIQVRLPSAKGPSKLDSDE